MRRRGFQDARIVITSPAHAEDLDTASPIEEEEPDDLVFCCFFRELEQRIAFLQRLRTLATSPLETSADPETLTKQFADEYARLQREGDSGGAFFVVVQWWLATRRRGYHAYSLKVGSGPYRTSCLIAFRELDPKEVHLHLTQAQAFLQQEKARMLDFFGFEGP